MKIVSYKCPNCGAKLNSDLDRKSAFCDFCGSEIVFDEEFQKVMLHEQNIKDLVQEINKGMAYSQNKGVDGKTLDSIKKIKKALGEIDSLKIDMMEKQSKIFNQEKMRKELTSPIKRIIPWGIMVWMIYILVQMVRYSYIHIIFRLPIFLLGMIISVISFRVINFSVDNKVAEIDENLEALRAEVEEQNDRIIKIQEESNFRLIPEDYLYEEAVDYIYNALATKRALTIQQAILNYEEKLQRDRLEDMRQEELRLQKQQLNELKNIQKQNAELRKETARMMEENKKNSKRGFGVGDAVRLGSAFAIGASVAKKIKDDLL